MQNNFAISLMDKNIKSFASWIDIIDALLKNVYGQKYLYKYR